MSGDSYISTAVRINISKKTFYILKCDENCFAMLKPNKNVNRVSDTLVNTIVNNIEFSSFPESEDYTYNTCSENMKFNYKPDKEADEKFRNNKINYRGIYVSRLLEYYAGKAYYEREQIYYKKCIQEINNVLACKNLLEIRYRDNPDMQLIYPFDIRTDEWSSYNYLIGTDITNARSKEDEKLVNFRIAYISRYRQVEKKPMHPECRFSREKIEEMICSRGVQFVSEEPIEIKLRLTKKGKDMYDHMVFMRPQISEMPTDDEPDIYTFRCTATQARFYFFKFGADVDIISPDSLRNDFFNQYTEAYLLYKGNNNT